MEKSLLSKMEGSRGTKGHLRALVAGDSDFIRFFMYFMFMYYIHYVFIEQ